MSIPKSWVEYDPKTPFSIANIPFGIISTKSDLSSRHPAIAIGDRCLDLSIFASAGGFSGLHEIQDHLAVFSKPTLNDFAALGRPVHAAVRAYLQSILSADTQSPDVLRDNHALREKALLPLKSVECHVPMTIGDYTDFYAGRNHAYNIGVLFRGPDNALQPNYNYLPVGYHGRASSVVVSGTPVRRPWGQILTDPAVKVPSLEPCRRLDIELELGAYMCRENKLGEPIPVSEAEQYIFGYSLLNDWSARDIQAWEYVPLGPFTAKNFCSTVSPWIVLADALEPFKTAGLKNEADYPSYLKEENKDNVHDIRLEVDIIGKLFSPPPYRRRTDKTPPPKKTATDNVCCYLSQAPAAKPKQSASPTRATSSGPGPRWSPTTP
jgi:fumarylacetoacetase